MTELRRYPDWQVRLTAYLQRVVRHRFAWGEHDCALFVAGGIEAMTGTDLAAEYRGRYGSLHEGLRHLRGSGIARDHVDLAASLLPEIAPAFARAGDAAMVDAPEGRALGLVQGAQIYVLRPDGLGLVSLIDAQRAWRV